jgi:hypothetical protein
LASWTALLLARFVVDHDDRHNDVIRRNVPDGIEKVADSFLPERKSLLDLEGLAVHPTIHFDDSKLESDDGTSSAIPAVAALGLFVRLQCSAGTCWTLRSMHIRRLV